MKKIYSVIAALLLVSCLTIVSSCEKDDPEEEKDKKENPASPGKVVPPSGMLTY